MRASSLEALMQGALNGARRAQKPARERCLATLAYDDAFDTLKAARGDLHARTRAARHAHWAPVKSNSARRDAERYFAKSGAGVEP